jgi:hypothetical protein
VVALVRFCLIFGSSERERERRPPSLGVADEVPLGVVHLKEYQEGGWSYVRPWDEKN